MYLIAVLTAVLALFIKSYFQEKGRLKALKSSNKILTDEAEQIKINYSKELEALKKDHQLDISKRKYQYESKKEEYLKFFQLLDQFAKNYNVENQENLLPIIDEFNRNYLKATAAFNKKNETNAIVVFNKKIQKLVVSANQDLITLKQETNAIRLIASDQVLEKLNLLNNAYDQSNDISNKMMNQLPKQMMAGDEIGMKEFQTKIELSAVVINKIKEDIITLMRKELNEI